MLFSLKYLCDGPAEEPEAGEKERITSYSRSKLAGFYPSPGTGYSQDDTNHRPITPGSGPAPPPADPSGNAPSHIVPPPKPAKPKFVDMSLTSSQLASQQVTAQLILSKPDGPAQAQAQGKQNADPNAGSKAPPAGSKVFENKAIKKVVAGILFRHS